MQWRSIKESERNVRKCYKTSSHLICWENDGKLKIKYFNIN